MRRGGSQGALPVDGRFAPSGQVLSGGRKGRVREAGDGLPGPAEVRAVGEEVEEEGGEERELEL